MTLCLISGIPLFPHIYLLKAHQDATRISSALRTLSKTKSIFPRANDQCFYYTYRGCMSHILGQSQFLILDTNMLLESFTCKITFQFFENMVAVSIALIAVCFVSELLIYVDLIKYIFPKSLDYVISS